MPKENRRTVRLSLLLKVSKYGSGYYMRIPTDIANSLKLKSGDKVDLRIDTIIPKGAETLEEEE
jgi:antitoxin component of MazEF toxin-antitoxin module